MAITGDFGVSIDLESMKQRRWYIDGEGARRWADNDKPAVEHTLDERFKKELLWRINDISEMLQQRGVGGERIYGCDEWSTPILNLKALAGLIEEQNDFDREHILDALSDCANGLKYIRQQHGELYGVGFDRALGKADAILSPNAYWTDIVDVSTAEKPTGRRG